MAVLVALGALVAAASRGVMVFVEVLVLIGVLAGLTVSLRGPRRRSRAPAPAAAPPPDPDVAGAAGAVLERLDRIEHRRVELDGSWPAIVVGPTGIHLVDVCPPATSHGGCAVAGSSAEGCPRCEHNARTAQLLQRTVDELDLGRGVPVRPLAVVAAAPPEAPALREPGSVETAPVGPVPVEIVPVDRLHDALVRGPVLPMATVERAFRALASLEPVRSARR